MNAMIFDPSDDLNLLRPLLEEWKGSANSDQFGVPLGVDETLQTLRGLVVSPHTELLVAVDDAGAIRGFVGITFQRNHVGPGLIAHECLFFVSGKRRGCGVVLMRAFKRMAKARGCCQWIMNASRLAGDVEISGKFFEAFGMKPYEISYVGGL